MHARRVQLDESIGGAGTAGMTRRMLGGLGLLLCALGARPAGAEEGEPAQLEPVVVTVTRMEQQFGEAPASVTVLTRRDVSRSASQSLDDLLRQVPGFSLFRRSSSLVSHPTTQGLSLRGIGPSGTSRALVLLDGIPINDPFGGWVYWDKIPLASIEQVEVVRGGGSSVWGNYALGGVVNVITRRPTEGALSLEGSYGNRNTLNLDALGTEAQGPFRLSLEVSHLNTDGYPVVKASRRGAIDIDADSNHTTFNGRTELVLSPDASFFVRGTNYDEDRGNGTPLQNNETHAGSFALGGRMRTGDGSDWSMAVFADFQRFRSTFSTQAADRNSETLALDQTVPSTAVGASLQWSRRFGSHLALAGADFRWIAGETDEKVFNAGVFLRNRIAGGEQILSGVFVQDVWTPHPQWELVAGVRGDYWKQFDGTRRDTPPPAGVPPQQTFADVDWLAGSPRVAALFHATPTTDLRAAAYQGFRVPTINELYRPFRVRNDVTVANANLDPERLTGGELGLQQRVGPFQGRITGFWNEVKDLVANVTLTTPLPDCPAGTTCRQRQNLDLARIRGFETELELRPARDWRIVGSYIYTDTRVVRASQQPALEGKRLAQVPEHGASLSVRYENPAWFDASVTARYVGTQFEDDLNTLPLGSFVTVDLFVSRRITKWGEVFLGIENLFDTTYTTGRTTDGVISIGAPFLVHGGVRLTF
jgi:outer membrane receptor protein involved in Fe transport